MARFINKEASVISPRKCPGDPVAGGTALRLENGGRTDPRGGEDELEPDAEPGRQLSCISNWSEDMQLELEEVKRQLSEATQAANEAKTRAKAAEERMEKEVQELQERKAAARRLLEEPAGCSLMSDQRGAGLRLEFTQRKRRFKEAKQKAEGSESPAVKSKASSTLAVPKPGAKSKMMLQAFDISGLNMYDGAGALVAFDSHRLYRFQAADTASKEKSWIAVYGLVAMILIAVSPIAYYEGPQALLMVISYLSAVTLVKVFVKETINLGYPYPNTLTAMHMLAVCLVTLIFERPKMDEALKVALLNSILAAVCLNITQWYAMKALGALMSSIVGNLNLILVIALSIAWLHEQVTAWQYVGVLLLATGTFTNKMQGFCFSSQNGNTTPRTDNPRKTPDSQRHDEVQALRLAAEQRKKDLQALLQQDEEERGESFGTLHARLQCAEASKEALEVQLASITSHAERLAFEREDLLCRLNEDRALLPVFVKPSRRPSERSLRRLRQTTGFTFVVLLLLAICAYVKALHVIDLGDVWSRHGAAKAPKSHLRR
eukprot:g27921.t1